MTILAFLFIGFFIVSLGLGTGATIQQHQQEALCAELDESILAIYKDLAHTVTIRWLNEEAPITITVREDHAWDIIAGVVTDEPDNPDFQSGPQDMSLPYYMYGIYRYKEDYQIHIGCYNANLKEADWDELMAAAPPTHIAVTAMKQAAEKGLTFGGLYTLPNGGGTQYADRYGHTIKSVTGDIVLYPMWE